MLDILEKTLMTADNDKRFEKVRKLCDETKGVKRLFLLDRRGYDGEYEFVCSADFDSYDSEFDFTVRLERIFDEGTQLALLEKDILVQKERLDAVFEEIRSEILKGKVQLVYERK